MENFIDRYVLLELPKTGLNAQIDGDDVLITDFKPYVETEKLKDNPGSNFIYPNALYTTIF